MPNHPIAAAVAVLLAADVGRCDRARARAGRSSERTAPVCACSLTQTRGSRHRHLTLHSHRLIELRRPDDTLSFEGSTVDVATAGVRTEIEIDRRIRERLAALIRDRWAA